MKEVLEPCPFCGCKAEVLEYGEKSYIVFCRECRAETTSFLNIDEAEKAWDMRV